MDAFTRLSVPATSALLIILSAGPASAHSQTVQPPAQDAPTVSGPISNSWAQAHCHANSPAVVADASNDVVTFTPSAPKTCDPIPNPGGQVHP